MRETGQGPATKTKYAPSQTVRMHRRQLFHWIGSHLVHHRRLDDSTREKYVSCLRSSLQQGLWLRVPRDPDILLDGEHFEVTRPICCFTETGLDDIEDHSRKYGRLGLGFPKRFVLENGGRPVNYLLGKKTDPSMQAWLRLAETLQRPEVQESLSDVDKSELNDCLSFVSHFLKAMKHTSQKKFVPRKETERKMTKGQGKPVPNPHQRLFGSPLHFLEEREWRFVLRKLGKRLIPRGVRKNVTGNSTEEADWLMPYTAGKDLFTVVFPDNGTLAMAVDDSFIRSKLFDKSRPHVTLLTLEDIGTF